MCPFFLGKLPMLKMKNLLYSVNKEHAYLTIRKHNANNRNNNATDIC